MNGYDNRGTTLDPGLTALALRARARNDESYVFVMRVTDAPWWRRAWAAATRALTLHVGERGINGFCDSRR
jgi:ABC-type sugar transport system substrate-binding protein